MSNAKDNNQKHIDKLIEGLDDEMEQDDFYLHFDECKASDYDTENEAFDNLTNAGTQAEHVTTRQEDTWSKMQEYSENDLVDPIDSGFIWGDDSEWEDNVALEPDNSGRSTYQPSVIAMQELCVDTSKQQGHVKDFIEMARMSAYCRSGKKLLIKKNVDICINVEGIDLLVAIVGNSGIEQGIRTGYDIFSKLLPFPVMFLQYRSSILAEISGVNYEFDGSGDVSDWQHLHNKGQRIKFDMDKCYKILSLLLHKDLRTGDIVINPVINFSEIANSHSHNGNSIEYTQYLQDLQTALVSKLSEIELYREKRRLQKSLSEQIINNESNIKQCLSHSMQHIKNNKVKSVITFIGPAESGRSTLAHALYDVTNELNNTQAYLINIDCAQYVHENCVAHFTGIEPFYRSPKQGFLTHKVEQNPYSVVVFKNLNYAHKNLQTLVQNLIQNGYVEDTTTERKVSFEHVQIIVSLEDKSIIKNESSKLKLSGDALLADKSLGLDSSLAAALSSHSIIRTDRLTGLDTYELCRRKLCDYGRTLELKLNATPYLPALTLIGCGKNDLPSAIDNTIVSIFNDIKCLNYDYIIDQNIKKQPPLTIAASVLPKKCAIVGMQKKLKGHAGFSLHNFSAEQIMSDQEQLLDFKIILITQQSTQIVKLLRTMSLHKDCLIGYIGTEPLDSHQQTFVDGNIALEYLEDSAQLCEQLMALYAVKCQRKHKRRQTLVTLSPSLSTTANKDSLHIDFDSYSEEVNFDPEIFNKPYFSVIQPKERLEDVIGYDEVKEQLKDVIGQLNSNEVNQNPPPKGLIFEGPPGTGKTFLALAMAGESGLNVITANASDLMSDNGIKNINSLIDAAESVAPAIVFIDEFDAIGRKRDEQSVGYAAIVNTLLTRMDGSAKPETPVLYVAATNYAEKLDPALLRAGRFDRSICFTLPNLQERQDAIEVYAAKKSILTSSEETRLLAIMFEGLTHKAIENKFLETLDYIGKKQERPTQVRMPNVINAIYPIPDPSEEYDPKLEYRLTIQAYRLASKLVINQSIYRDITHIYLNVWHACYFYNAQTGEHISYTYFCNKIKKLLCERAAEALYVGRDTDATTFTIEEYKHIIGLSKTALNALNISEKDFFTEFPNLQNSNNADSALIRKLYKQVKADLLYNWPMVESIASGLLKKGFLDEAELTKIMPKKGAAPGRQLH